MSHALWNSHVPMDVPWADRLPEFDPPVHTNPLPGHYTVTNPLYSVERCVVRGQVRTSARRAAPALPLARARAARAAFPHHVPARLDRSCRRARISATPSTATTLFASRRRA